MPHWLSRLLWMSLQGAIVVLVMVTAHYGTVERGEVEQPGLAFILGCGAAIAVTFLLTKAWDLSRAGLAWLRRAGRARVHDGEKARGGSARIGGAGDRAGQRSQLGQGSRIE